MSNIERAPQEILRLTQQDVPSLSESEFVTNWLLTLHEYISGGDVKIGYWLEHNRISTFSEVEIKDGSGTVIYNVPSIFIKQDQVLPKSITAEMGDIMYRAEGLNKTIPGRGDSFIESTITNHVLGNNDLPEYQRRWDAIFTRYNLEPVFSNASSSTNQVSDEGFDEYDEL